MQERTRNTILIGLCFLFIVLLGVWWYFGFSLDFMRFFAAEPGILIPNPPEGCFYQEVQCIQAPCPPQLVCPSTAPNVPLVCAPLTQTVTVGQTAMLAGAGGIAPYAWFAPEGSITNSSDNSTSAPTTVSVTYTTPGTKKVTVQAGRKDNSGSVDSVACTVIVTP